MNTAAEVKSILDIAIGAEIPVRIRAWDGSEAGASDSAATLVVRNRRALRHLLWAPHELGLVRAFISGDLDIEGQIFDVLDLASVIDRLAAHQPVGLSGKGRWAAVRSAVRLGAVGLPPPLPHEEIRTRRGIKHSLTRDAAMVSHHYDVGNEFYRLILGPTMVYSCAYWAAPPSPSFGLDDAQEAKCELVCTKLGLQPGMRVLDVGCGWGGFVLHAARHHGVHAVGITVSHEQATLARERVAAAGLDDRVEIRQQDYRDIVDGPYDAIASIGMSEHVGWSQLPTYAAKLFALLRPEGRLLNHAISSVRSLPTVRNPRPGFIDRYIFPDGEVLPLSKTVDALEQAGFEVRDSEALREHYALTLRAWTQNLQSSWGAALELVPATRARTWLLYLASCALAFDHGGLTIHQVLAVRQDPGGGSGLPRTRGEWLAPVPDGGAAG